MADATKKCKHQGCGCMATKDSPYCSILCKDTDGKTLLQCDCGHPACSSSNL